MKMSSYLLLSFWQEIIELKEVNTDDINKNIEAEGDLILNNIRKNDFVIALSIPGKNISSEEFKDSILKSEEKLMEEYFKIDQIRMESFKNAMNEQIIYI